MEGGATSKREKGGVNEPVVGMARGMDVCVEGGSEGERQKSAVDEPVVDTAA